MSAQEPCSPHPPLAMRWIDGGVFTMGSNRFYPEEAPARAVRVDGFWIDETPVTNADFARFVTATGYVTLAELPPEPIDYPGLSPELARPGSAVFRHADRPVDLGDPSHWWHYCFGADWRHPTGPDSSIVGLEDHPVVHVAHRDAAAYATWVGKALPTEAEWECAARGGLDSADYAWGDALAPGGAMLANYWRGRFPYEALGGWERTSPVRTFPANGFGLYDMIGNVWEWTEDWYADARDLMTIRSCCTPANPRGGTEQGSQQSGLPVRIPRKVLKGGSHLCAPNYCQRYRPAARQPEPIDTSTSHIGFRCIRRDVEGKSHAR